jgi:hypothetical protein
MDPKDRSAPTIEWNGWFHAWILLGFANAMLIHPPEAMPGHLTIRYQHR